LTIVRLRKVTRADMSDVNLPATESARQAPEP
jgi:hypothetical protein